MKKKILTTRTILLFIIGSATFTSCGNSSSNENQSNANEPSTGNESVLGNSKGLSPILENYLSLKNALYSDNAKSAAESGIKLLSAFKEFDKSSLSEEKLKKYNEIVEDAMENAEHISENEDKIDHQREHLVALSEDINDLIKLIGTDKKLYQVYCPMANEGKGAMWISETKEIKNPYIGGKMPSCGEIKHEIK